MTERRITVGQIMDQRRENARDRYVNAVSAGIFSNERLQLLASEYAARELESFTAKQRRPLARREKHVYQLVEATMGGDLTRKLGESKWFEQNLYSQGVLNINPETWMDERDYRKKDSEYYAYELEWLKQYNGKVPASWEIWYGITHTMEDAGRYEVQLTSNLIDAALDYPHPGCVSSTALNQKLSVEQLAKALGRSSWSNDEEIIQAQTKRGMTKKMIEAAKEIAGIQDRD